MSQEARLKALKNITDIAEASEKLEGLKIFRHPSPFPVIDEMGKQAFPPEVTSKPGKRCNPPSLINGMDKRVLPPKMTPQEPELAPLYMPCRRCKSLEGVIKKAKPPQYKRLECLGCGLLYKWIQKPVEKPRKREQWEYRAPEPRVVGRAKIVLVGDTTICHKVRNARLVD